MSHQEFKVPGTHYPSLARSNRTDAVCSSFVLLCTVLCYTLLSSTASLITLSVIIPLSLSLHCIFLTNIDIYLLYHCLFTYLSILFIFYLTIFILDLPFFSLEVLLISLTIHSTLPKIFQVIHLSCYEI